MNFVHFFSFSPIVTFFGSIFGRFWPPIEVQSMPKVPIWTLTPSCNIWAGDQPKSGPWLLILSRFFDFSFVLSFLAILGLWGAFAFAVGAPKDPYEVVNFNNNPPPMTDLAASSIFRIWGLQWRFTKKFNFYNNHLHHSKLGGHWTKNGLVKYLYA